MKYVANILKIIVFYDFSHEILKSIYGLVKSVVKLF